MLQQGQIAETVITGYTSEGLGVCRIEGCTVFVPGAIRGERCEIRVTHVGKHSAHGKIESILAPSPHRIPRSCPAAKRCGGCQYWHMDYEAERQAKAQRVADALTRLGGVYLTELKLTGADGTARVYPVAERVLNVDEPTQSPPPCHSEERSDEESINNNREILRCAQNDRGERLPEGVCGYRNKAQYQLGSEKGTPVAGFYRSGTHQLIPVSRCPILPEISDRAAAAVLRWAREGGVSVYDENTRRGLLRNLFVRVGFRSGQVMVCIVANGGTLPKQERLLQLLREQIPGLASVVLSVNQTPGNTILGEKFVTLYGKGYIEDTLCGLRFRLSPRSFYQVNPVQAERLYEKAVAAAELTGSETVLDLYCGTGTITLVMAKHAGRAIGVELVPQAIEDAKENARRNGVENAEFFCADAAEAAQRFAAAGTRPDVIVVDPPRKGLSPDVIDAIGTMAPQRVVYVSCDPATLARDVKLLSTRGYRLQSAEAVDMFPRTAHVESVVKLIRQ